ncbi:hypothetical protein G9A89_005165 [Geosiphon pyriformis]|nr:hypothetical protein G9A89_005165 [Geosiphon pyriformis]
MWHADKYDPLQAGSIDGTDTVPHDHGIQRAQESKYLPPNDTEDVTSDPFKTIFVGRLNPETTEETLESVFERFGAIQKIRLVRNIVTGDSRGYAFIEYTHERSCQDAYKNANKIMLDDRQILVDFERSRVMEGWIPRRLGGGFGGRKESGQLRFGSRDRPFKRPLHVAGIQAVPEILPEQRYDDCWRRLSLSKSDRLTIQDFSNIRTSVFLSSNPNDDRIENSNYSRSSNASRDASYQNNYNRPGSWNTTPKTHSIIESVHSIRQSEYKLDNSRSTKDYHSKNLYHESKQRYSRSRSPRYRHHSSRYEGKPIYRRSGSRSPSRRQRDDDKVYGTSREKEKEIYKDKIRDRRRSYRGYDERR